MANDSLDTDNLSCLIQEIALQDNDPSYAHCLRTRLTKKERDDIQKLKSRISLMEYTKETISLFLRLELHPSFIHLNRFKLLALTKSKQAIVQLTIKNVLQEYLTHIQAELVHNSSLLSKISPPNWSLPNGPNSRLVTNWRERNAFESHLKDLNQKCTPDNCTPLLELTKDPPLFWSDSLQSKADSLIKDCIALINSSEDRTLIDSDSEKTIDKEKLFSIKKIGPNLHSIALVGQHLPVPPKIVKTLSLGLNFVPETAKFDFDCITPAFITFRNKLRWSAFFASKSSSLNRDLTYNDILPLKLRSRLAPKLAPNNTKLDLFAKNLMLSLVTKIQESPMNLLEDITSRNVRQTHNFFKKNRNSLILKPADKGGATVLMSYLFYRTKMQEMLSNSASCFQVINENPIFELIQEVHLTLMDLRDQGFINQSLFDMLIPSEKARCPCLYGLPKIHKSIIALRPIVSGNEHATEPISIFLDYILQPYAIESDFYLKDTTDLLNILSNLTLPPDDPNLLLFNLDVVGMYTNIPLKEASSSIDIRISANPSLLIRGKTFYSKYLIKKLVELTLNNNFFQFNDVFYHQILGIAMGTPCACTVSDIFICLFMKKAFKNWHDLPLIYKQYRDDGFGVWNLGLPKLLAFLDYLNSLHPTIKFTMNFGRSIDYLDARISIDPFNRFKSETFYKETETFEFLHPSSNHPHHCKNNIALSQNIRHLRLNSSPNSFLHHANLLRYNLIKRGYSARIVDRKMRIYNFKHRSNLLKYKKRTPLTRVPLILTYSSLLPNIPSLIRNELGLLDFNKDELDKIGGIPLVGYTISPSIGKSIIRANYPP